MAGAWFSTAAQAVNDLPGGPAVTKIAQEQAWLHLFMLILCTVIFVAVFSVMFYSIWKHRKSVEHKAVNFHKSVTVEVIWAIVSPIIVILSALPAIKIIILSNLDPKPSFSSADVSGADFAKDFSLTDHHDQPRAMADFRGKVVVMFFGYTQCPDACPTIMLELAEVKRQLGEQGDKLQALFVTLDPERDTPEVLQAYMANFDPSFLALYTTPDKLLALSKAYKIYYRKAEGKTAGSYTLDHAAGSYVYDTQGRLRLYTRYGSGAQALAADIKLLLASK